jgi:hypothetical protein
MFHVLLSSSCAGNTDAALTACSRSISQPAHGIAVNSVVYGWADANRVTSILQLPDFASSARSTGPPQLSRDCNIGADLWASNCTPERELQLAMTRLRSEGGDIAPFHDTRSAMLKALKDKGYRVVHIAPAMAQPPPPIMSIREVIELLWKRTVDDGNAQ